MKMNRRYALTVALIVTITLVGWTAFHDNEDDINLVARKSTSETFATKAKSAEIAGRNALPTNQLSLNRDPLMEASADPFAAVNFVPPPPVFVAPPPPPPPKPTAPPFPYHYFGRMMNIDGINTTYLQRGETLVAIQDKQILENTYRIEAIEETQIVFTYLPLEEKAILTIQTAENNSP